MPTVPNCPVMDSRDHMDYMVIYCIEMANCPIYICLHGPMISKVFQNYTRYLDLILHSQPIYWCPLTNWCCI